MGARSTSLVRCHGNGVLQAFVEVEGREGNQLSAPPNRMGKQSMKVEDLGFMSSSLVGTRG